MRRAPHTGRALHSVQPLAAHACMHAVYSDRESCCCQRCQGSRTHRTRTRLCDSAVDSAALISAMPRRTQHRPNAQPTEGGRVRLASAGRRTRMVRAVAAGRYERDDLAHEYFRRAISIDARSVGPARHGLRVRTPKHAGQRASTRVHTGTRARVRVGRTPQAQVRAHARRVCELHPAAERGRRGYQRAPATAHDTDHSALRSHRRRPPERCCATAVCRAGECRARGACGALLSAGDQGRSGYARALQHQSAHPRAHTHAHHTRARARTDLRARDAERAAQQGRRRTAHAGGRAALLRRRNSLRLSPRSAVRRPGAVL